MPLKTTLAQLEEVQTAITAVLAGQEVTLNGKRLVRANLKDLEARETYLLRKYQTEQGTGGLAVSTAVLKRNY